MRIWDFIPKLKFFTKMYGDSQDAALNMIQQAYAQEVGYNIFNLSWPVESEWICVISLPTVPQEWLAMTVYALKP